MLSLQPDEARSEAGVAAWLARRQAWFDVVTGNAGDTSKCIVGKCCSGKGADLPCCLCQACQEIVWAEERRIERDETAAEMAALTCDHGVSVATFCAECPPPPLGVSVDGAPVPWVKLRRGDDWGAVYFALEPAPRGQASRALGLKTYAGDPVEVRWPTGEVSTECITMVEVRTDISEQGQRGYVAACEVPHIRTVVRGKMGDVAIDTPLDRVEVRETWVKERTLP